MEYWSSSLISLLFIGILLFVGKILKSKIRIFSRIVMPTALLGGIIGLLFSSVVIPGSYTLDVSALTAIVYHALAIGFLALSLKRSEHKNKRKLWSTGMVITSTYALQGFIGILMVMIFWPKDFVGSGMLLALGFGQGPGLAISFGNMWNNMLGGQGGALGASYAFLGFLWGGIVGVIAINVMSKRKGLQKPQTYSSDDSVESTTIQVDTVKEVSVLDGLTVQLVIIAIIYAAVWGTLFLMEKVLLPLGTIGNTIFGLLKGFNFIIAILYALVYKVILRAVEKRQKKEIKFLTNDYILSNISSTSFNVMIAGSVLTITVDFLVSYGWLLLAISTVGGIATLFYVRYLTKRVYNEYKDEYFVALFGNLTGVASTGIALLKGLDRNLETPVAEELVLGSGTAISIALPLFAFLMIPALGYDTTNESLMNLISLFGCLAYVIVIVIILLIRSRKRPA